MNTYKIQDWVFRDALGKYDIDLGDSNAPCITAGQVCETGDAILDYGTDRGGIALRQQVAALYRRDPADIGVTHGSQEALYLIYRTVLAPGDHVIAFSPGWPQSWRVPTLIGCDLTVLPYAGDFSLDIPAIEAALRPDTRAVILNVPCNPTGRGIDIGQRRRLIQLIERRNTYLIADEEYLVDFDDSLVHLYQRALSVSSLSKVFGVPGLRLGWLCGPTEVVESAMEYKHLTTISNSTLCERLGAKILAEREDHLARYRRLMYGGYEILREWTRSHSANVQMIEPDGTPFCWLRLGGVESSLEFCRRLLDRTRVLTMPAELFGERQGLRLTFAREPAELEEGLRRIASLFLDRTTDA